GGHLVGANLQAHLNALEKQMRDAAADLDFETAAHLRDEIKRLKAVELAAMDDPMARQEAASVEGARGSGKTPAQTQESARGGGNPASPLAGEDSSPQEAKPIGGANLVRGDEPRVSLSSRSKTGRPEGKGSYFAKPHLDEMGADGAVPTGRSLFRKNTLDE
ncbi:MAG: UvrB/UvrC motif-containing protein, partial [Rhizobiaceae bacterium]|nr:UvrB/UvrC motif-containing protein [Rhizobiaceae bacterium]